MQTAMSVHEHLAQSHWILFPSLLSFLNFLFLFFLIAFFPPYPACAANVCKMIMMKEHVEEDYTQTFLFPTDIH